jgi:hypothetical protein
MSTPRPRISTPTKGTPSAGQPDMFDTLIQSSAVSLFHAYGVAAAPLTPTELSFEEFRPYYPLAAIGFRAPGLDAALILSVPPEVAALLSLGQGSPPSPRELARELANQAMGRIKNRLSQYQVNLRCTLPVCADQHANLERVAPQRGRLVVYGLRTVHRQIVIAIKGLVETSALTYSSATRLNGEGDIIVFEDPTNRGEGAQS